MRKDKMMTFVLFVLPAIIIGFLGLLLVEYNYAKDLEERNRDLGFALQDMQTQMEFYRQAYTLAIADLHALSQVYGDEERYEKLAEELRDIELEIILGTSGGEGYELRNKKIWDEYVALGVINTSCLNPPIIISSTTDDVLLTVKAHADVTKNITLYIDANRITEIPVTAELFEPEEQQLTVSLTEGVHEFTLIASEGSLTIAEMMLETNTVDLAHTTADTGIAWDVFDCADTSFGGRLASPGAIRFLVEKK